VVAANDELFMSDTPSENLDQPAAPVMAAALTEVPSASEATAAITGIDAELDRLPTYARGLLQIRVPVRVTLASQRKSIQEIIELGPGSIVKFDKTCDEPLELCVGNRPIAHGEVVKVGDKFGLKISGLVK
jgi:flagellar motor switch protein FliN/FliY